MGNAASGLPFVVGEEVDSYPESPETCSWRMHSGTKRVSQPVYGRAVGCASSSHG